MITTVNVTDPAQTLLQDGCDNGRDNLHKPDKTSVFKWTLSFSQASLVFGWIPALGRCHDVSLLGAHLLILL